MGKKDDAVMYLVRHGATAANDSGRLQGRGIDLPLSPGGCEQIAVTADALAGLPVSAIYSSPLVRTQQTAAIIREAHGLPVTLVATLVEVDVGRWEGKSWEEIRAEDGPTYDRFVEEAGRCGYPDGESYDSVYRRVRPAFDELLAAHTGERIIVVAHSVVNRTYLAGLLGLPPEAAREISQANGAINVIRRRGGCDRVVTMNAKQVF